MPEPTALPLPTRSEAPTPAPTEHAVPTERPHMEGGTFAHVGPLTPFVFTLLALLLLVLSVTSFSRFVRKRRDAWRHDTSVLPRNLK